MCPTPYFLGLLCLTTIILNCILFGLLLEVVHLILLTLSALTHLLLLPPSCTFCEWAEKEGLNTFPFAFFFCPMNYSMASVTHSHYSFIFIYFRNFFFSFNFLLIFGALYTPINMIGCRAEEFDYTTMCFVQNYIIRNFFSGRKLGNISR